MRAQISCLFLIVCGCCATRPAPDALVSAFADRTASDESLLRDYTAARQPPPADEGRAWVAIVRDPSRTPTARRLAFAAFARRFLRPGDDLREIVHTYGIADWFTADTLLDWTHSSSTPLDMTFRLGVTSHRIFALVAPAGLAADLGPLRNAYVCFALPTDLDDAGLVAVLHAPRHATGEENPTAPTFGEENLFLAGVIVVDADEDAPEPVSAARHGELDRAENRPARRVARGPRGEVAPPCHATEPSRCAAGGIRTLDLRPSPARPAGPRGLRIRTV